MKPRLIALLVANLLVASPLAFAADGITWTGSSSLGYRYTNENAADPSKLNEYRDLGSGAIYNMEFRGRSDNDHFTGFLENFGQDDYYLDMKGGRFGIFRYQIYSNELRHNFGSGPGARTPYAGAGTPRLTGQFPNLTEANWNGYDDSYTRRDTGGMLEFSFNSPWYVRLDANELARTGGKMLSGGSEGTSPGNGFVQLPSPVDFTTRNMALEGGYQGKDSHIAANVMYSKFTNDNPLLFWSNGFFSPTNPFLYDTTTMPPSNELWRLSVNGNLRKLPGNSTLAGRLTYSQLTNDVQVLANTLGTVAQGTFPATASSSPTFEGKMETATASITFNSRPLRDLDTRLYYNWADEKNKSTQLTFTPTAASGLQCAGGPCTPELFAYTKNNIGAEAAYRLTRGNKFTVGYDYLDAERERIDFTRNIDNRWLLEWKNTSLDTLSGRVKYQHLLRRSTYELPASAIAANPMEPFVRRFDLANVNQDLVKLVLDFSPRPFLDFGFEAIFKKNDYKDTSLGRIDDQRQEYYLSLAFGDPKKLRFIVFGDVELMEFNSDHRVGGTPPASPDPSQPPSPLPPATASTYNWTAKNKDKSWMVGIGSDWLPTPRLTVKASVMYAETDGSTEFAALASGGVTPVVDQRLFLPITNSDDTKRTSVNLKGTYTIDRNWSVTGGYAYERYKYSDIGYDGFKYTVGSGATASYMTGQGAFQPYSANIFYAMGTYKF